MKIQAAVFYEKEKPFQIETLDLDEPKAGEVLVKVQAAGVCHSDYHLVTGALRHKRPVVPGHEGAGRVEAVGAGVTRVKPGDFVALNWAPNCGECFYCLDEHPSLCETYIPAIWSGVMLDGAPRLSKDGQPVYHFSAISCFAEYAVVPQESCVPLPKEIPPAVAALIGCAVTTGVGSVINTAAVKPGASVVVYGAGGVGLSTIMGAKLSGAGQIIAVDITPAKLEIAHSFGATETLLAGDQVPDQIKDLTGGRGADYVFEAIGIPQVQEQSLQVVRPGGTVVFEGISPMGSETNLPGAIITRKEISIKGSYYGSGNTAREFPKYADLYLRGMLAIDQLVTRTYSLDQINEAYADMIAGNTARGVIVFPD